MGAHAKRCTAKWSVGLALALVICCLGLPKTAVATGEITSYIIGYMSYGSNATIHSRDHGVMGDIYHYGTYNYASHVVRSLYVQSLRDKLWTYIEVGQVYYAGRYTPTKHFYAYEDLGYTTSQRLYTFGNCAKSTWYTCFADLNYPTKNSWRVGRTGATWASALAVHMNWGVVKASMERSATSDDGHGSYHNLKYKGPGPTVWALWNSGLTYADTDWIYRPVTRSSSSFYTTAP